MEPEQPDCELTTSPRQKKPSKFSSVVWRTKQIVAVAQLLNHSLTPETIAMYIESLSDLSDEQFRDGLKRSVDELDWFPKPAQLRKLAGIGQEDVKSVEADHAWNYVQDYLRRWGVNPLPVRCAGRLTMPPTIPPRIDYALRRIGGLSAVNQVSLDSLPFMRKDFAEAYLQAAIAAQLVPQLEEAFGVRQLPGTVKKLGAGKPLETDSEQNSHPPQLKPKGITEPLSDAELRDRRKMLKQQLILLMGRMRTASVG